MKNLITILAIVVLLLLGGCHYDNIVSPIESEKAGIDMKVMGKIMSRDTIKIAYNTTIMLEAVPTGNPAPNIKKWQWVYDDNTVSDTGKYVFHKFIGNPGTTRTTILIGTDSLGNNISKTKWFLISLGIDGQPPIAVISSTPNGTGAFNIVMIFYKDYILNTTGKFFCTGNIYDPPFGANVLLSATDTNYNYVSGSLIPAPAGTVGKYVALRATLLPRSGYQLGLGRLVGDTTAVWGQWGQPYANQNGLVSFDLSSTGQISFMASPTTLSVPGVAADTVVNFDGYTDKLRIYVNNNHTFDNKGFVIFQDNAGVWQQPVMQQPVVNFPSWGYVDLPKSNINIQQGLVTFKFGPNVLSPETYNPNLNRSYFYNPLYGVIKIMVVEVNSLGKKILSVKQFTQ